MQAWAIDRADRDVQAATISAFGREVAGKLPVLLPGLEPALRSRLAEGKERSNGSGEFLDVPVWSFQLRRCSARGVLSYQEIHRFYLSS